MTYSYFASGIEQELASFLQTEDLAIRASKEKSAALSKKFTDASDALQLCAQHGVSIEESPFGKAIVLYVDQHSFQTLMSAALECSDLKPLDNRVLCTLPVIVKGPSPPPSERTHHS